MATSKVNTERAITRFEDCAQPQSPLLSLPGETRNLLYTYMVDEPYDPVLLYRQHTYGSSPSQTPAWAKLERQGLGFTQVCALIRQEILPLYRSKAWLSLWYDDILEYTRLIFPVPAKAAGVLEIRYPIDIQGNPLDIVPLVRLTLQATGLRFYLKTPWLFPDQNKRSWQVYCEARREHLLADFLDPHKNRDGLERAAELFEEIVVRCDGQLTVSILVDAAYAETWKYQLCYPERGMSSIRENTETIKLVKSVRLCTRSAYCLHGRC